MEFISLVSGFYGVYLEVPFDSTFRRKTHTFHKHFQRQRVVRTNFQHHMTVSPKLMKHKLQYLSQFMYGLHRRQHFWPAFFSYGV